jgi:hypothetical protein
MTAHIINLDSRADRWQECQSLPFELERISAVRHEWGWKGLNLTMSQLFQTKFTGEPMLVMEDDAVMVRDRAWLDLAVHDLPADFHMLMLGANIKESVEIQSEYLARVYGAWTTHAVLYSADLIRHLIQILPDLQIPVDEYFRTVIHPQGRSYVVRPMVCYQRASFSDIEGRHNDYTDLFEQSNKLLF